MPSSQRESAQRKRAEARDRRRSQSSDDNGEAPEANGSDDQSLDSLKQAAKVAATSAALGALMAGARALSQRRDPSTDEEEQRGPEEDAEEPSAESTPEERPDENQLPEPEPEQQEQQQTEGEPPPEPQRQPEGASPDEAREVVQQAQRQLGALLGKEPETVSALENTGEGWLVTLEVVEVSRIPESTDVLASYEIELADDLKLLRYARVRRYSRSQADQGGMQ